MVPTIADPAGKKGIPCPARRECRSRVSTGHPRLAKSNFTPADRPVNGGAFCGYRCCGCISTTRSAQLPGASAARLPGRGPVHLRHCCSRQSWLQRNSGQTDWVTQLPDAPLLGPLVTTAKSPAGDEPRGSAIPHAAGRSVRPYGRLRVGGSWEPGVCRRCDSAATGDADAPSRAARQLPTWGPYGGGAPASEVRIALQHRRLTYILDRIGTR